ncbi:MAG: immunoglobulin-like domain-containing protein [Roseicyclus sp.]|uniref:immunoglobulin-like domain-containing protein n=1 Tax=Roseicyclus sp. TaxID=1914329 RepID=UPI003A8B9C3F
MAEVEVEVETPPPAPPRPTGAVTLSAAPVAEGSDITITASVTNAPETDLVLTLSNGETITIGAGETTGSVSFANPNTDDVYADGGTQSYSVSSTSGGNYEALDIAGASVDVSVTDTVDTTTVTLSAAPVAEGSDITITASVTHAPETDLVLTLSNGETITIGAGETTGSVSFANPNTDDVYADGGTQSYSVSSTSGGNYEALDIAGASVDVSVTDTVDTTTVTLSAAPVAEGSDITITASVTNAPETDLVLTLSNGETITIGAGETTGSVSFANPNTDDVYADGGTQSYSVSSTSGGNYEALDIAGARVDVSVTDTVDTTTVTLSAAPVAEGSDITITASVTNAPETDLVLTLSNGAEITIGAGQTTGSVSFANPNTDDVYADGGTQSYSVSSTSGGNYEALDIAGASVDVSVTDTVDTTTVSVTTSDISEDATSVTFDFALSNAPEAGVPASLTVDVGGTEYTVALDASGAGSLTVTGLDNADVYVDEGSITATVTAITGGNFEATSLEGASATAEITDTVDTTTVTLSAAPVAEGSDITITASVTHAPETDLVLTLSNGETITIGAGQTTGSVSFANPNTDDVYADGGTQSYSVSSTSGGNYEALDIAGASVDVSVTDTIDTTTVTLAAAPVAEGSDITITASVTNAPETDLVLTLSNGETITIGAGQTTGSVSFANPNTDDVYADGGTQSYSVSSTSGGNYEALDIAGASVDVSVTDTIDTTTVTLAAAPVAEGSDITITASVTNAPETDLVLTLSNGETITIGAGQTTGSVSFANPNTDDVYADGGTQSYSVSSTSGGNYEALDIAGASVDVSVTDTIDTTTVTLAAAPVAEGSDITITASVTNAPETDLVLTLSNGETITIGAGQTTGSVSFANPNTDDVYADGGTQSYSVSSTSGGNYEALDIAGASVDVSVTDTVDTTTVTLSAAPVAEGSDITITASVTHAPETDLVLTLSNGAEITIGAGQTTGSVSFANPNTDDVYADGGTQSYSVSATSGGNYEALDLTGASVDVSVTDTVDTVTVSITSDGDVTEAQAASFTVSVSQALEDDLVVTLSTGETVTIEAGETSTSYTVAAQGDDVFADAGTVTVSVSGASVAGESFEDLVISPASATVAVSDTVDTTTVTLSASPVAEGLDITITASVTNAPETDLVLTLSNGETITIGAGETTGSVSFANPNTDDVYADGGTQSYSVSSTSGGNYEALDLTGARVDVSVTDTIDTTSVTLSAAPVAEGSDITITASVTNAPETDLVLTLSNGETITIGAGETTGSVSFANPNTDDVYADGGTQSYSVSSTSGGNYEALDIAGASVDVAVTDTIDTTSVTLSAAPVAEGSDITITASVTNAPETDLVLTLSNGETITIGAGQTTGSVSFANPNTDDVYADGGTQSYSVSATSGGNYEALDIAGASVDVTVTDTVDTVTVTLSAQPVLEGGQITIMARVDTAPETDLVLTLSNGETLTISTGQTSGTVSFANPNTEDAIIDAGTLTYGVTSVSGGNYEALDISGASVDVVVSDTDTTTKVMLEDVVVTEGEAFQYSASVDNAPASDLILTLSNGVTITIAAGETTGISESQTAPDTTSEFATTISIQSATGGGYERLDTGDTATLRVLDIDHPATISGLGAAGGDLVLDEGDFATGTNEVKDSLTQSGVFTISAEDGVGTLSIAGVTVISNGVFTPTEITTALGNTLSITSYSAETGEVGYSYTLLAAEDHLDGQTPNESLSESFTVSLTDRDGDHDTATLSVRIEDDAPVATVAQNIVIAASAQDQPITADMGVTVGADLDGATVVIAGDGTPVTNAQGVALTSDGQAIVYVSDGNGGLNAVINAGTGAQETIFTVSPSIAADGTVSYSVELVGTIDPVVGSSFDLSSAEEVESGKDDIVFIENDDGTTLTITAFENDGAETLTSTTGWEQEDVNISRQGMGVDNQFVSNSLKGNNKDNVGEKLVLEFGNDGNPMSVGAVGMTIDHLEDGETLIWVAYSGGTMVGQGELAGAGKGSSSASDQLLMVDPGQAFDRVELFAGEETGFRLAKNSIFTLDTVSHELNLSATVTDADNDQVTADFSIIFDNLSQSDLVIEGSDGDDVIYAGTGADTLIGGEGADTFLFEEVSDLGTSSGEGQKVISDFSSNDGDRLDLDSILGQIDAITNRISLNSGNDGPSSSSELTISAGEVDYEMVIRNLNEGDIDGGDTTHDALDIQTLLGASSNQSNWTDIVSMSGEFNGESDNSWTFQIIDERPNLTYEPDPVTGNLVFRDPNGLRVHDVDIAISQNGATHDVDNVDEISWSS